jgi:hypothetical protein
MAQAAQEMKAAERSLAGGDLASGEAAQEKAVEALRQAREALAERARRLREGEEADRAEMAEAQRRLADRAREAAKEASAIAPRASTEPGRRASEEASGSLGEAGSSLSEASGSMSQGDSSRARSAQGEAREALRRAQEALARAAQERGDSSEAQRRLRELRAEQEALRRQLKELEDLLRKAQEAEAGAAASGASGAMEETERRLESGSGERASQSAEEARRYLEEAKQALDRERRRYESLQQEEALFRLLDDLREFRAEEVRLREATAGLSDDAARGPLVRPKRRLLRTLADDQEALKKRLDERQKAAEEDGSVVFATGMALASADMAEVGRLLADERLGPLVLGLQDEVVHGLSNLIAGFEDEIQRRREPQRDGGGQAGGQGRPPLVPPSVEIKFLRRLQNDLNTKIETFWRQNPAVREGRLDERQRRTIERLYHQQGRLAENLERLMKSVFGGGGR